MQKEEAINIYKSFASMKKLPDYSLFSCNDCRPNNIFLNINAGLLFIYIDLFLQGFVPFAA